MLRLIVIGQETPQLTYKQKQADVPSHLLCAGHGRAAMHRACSLSSPKASVSNFRSHWSLAILLTRIQLAHQDETRCIAPEPDTQVGYSLHHTVLSLAVILHCAAELHMTTAYYEFHDMCQA